jgi:glycosyltransferase involved in cell wall biosynthesis
VKFSIITPSYNQGRYLEQTVNSILSQEGDFEIEYFIQDGGSTDNSTTVIKNTLKQFSNDKRLKVYWQSKKDDGQIWAINKALTQISGDIVAYINSDDYYLPGTFKKVQQHFETNPNSQWLVGNCLITDSKLKWTFWLKHLWPIQLSKNFILAFNTINQPSVFLRKELVDKTGSFDEKFKLAFDYDYWLRCSDISLPSRLYTNLSVFRTHARSKSNLNFHHQFDEDWLVFIKQQPNNFLYFIHAMAKDIVKFVYSYYK